MTNTTWLTTRLWKSGYSVYSEAMEKVAKSNDFHLLFIFKDIPTFYLGVGVRIPQLSIPMYIFYLATQEFLFWSLLLFFISSPAFSSHSWESGSLHFPPWPTSSCHYRNGWPNTCSVIRSRTKMEELKASICFIFTKSGYRFHFEGLINGISKKLIQKKCLDITGWISEMPAVAILTNQGTRSSLMNGIELGKWV